MFSASQPWLRLLRTSAVHLQPLHSSTPMPPVGHDAETVRYTERSYQLVPKKYTVDRKIAVRTYLDRNRSELSDRTYMPQKHFFEPYVPKSFSHEYERSAYDFYSIQTKLIWKAFDTPELILMWLFDETVKSSGGRRGRVPRNAEQADEPKSAAHCAEERKKGYMNFFSEELLDAAMHWTREARYWRCIGITKPFYNATTLRAHCWEDNGAQVGTLRMSAAMRHAVMDLERAWRRKELGLDPAYLWDNWGPIGFLDGRRTDYLPRFEHNPVVDPDGVTVTEVDVFPFNTHEQLRERYAEFIDADKTPFEGAFLAPTHSVLTLEDLPNPVVVELYKRLMAKGKRGDDSIVPHSQTGAASRHGAASALGEAAVVAASPADMRVLFYLCADPDLLAEVMQSHEAPAASATDAASGVGEHAIASSRRYASWRDICEVVGKLQEENDLKVDFARLLDNTRHSTDRVRSFFEEKCGFMDFMTVNDKTITAATLALLGDMKAIIAEYGDEWATDLANAMTDVEKFNVMGPLAFRVFRLIEDAILDRKRRVWATRFAGESNEESTLDYLLENFSRRPERQKSVGSTGAEFDREQEPIGRQVQRRVLSSDKVSKLADVRRSKGKLWNRKKSVFDALHEKQMQNFNYGVR